MADVDLSDAEPGLLAWMAAGMHGDMHYMEHHGLRRARPADLVPGTIRVLMVAADYAPQDAGWLDFAWANLADRERAYIARYALGRDYHKVVRGRLQKLADRIGQAIGPYGYRVFCDSAPVMEVELARKAGIGWRGKHTLLINAQRGSTFFLGSLYLDLALPVDQPTSAHCGRCERCLEVCPTQAIIAPYQLDARRCIAYLTIELKGAIPQPLRKSIGNRIFGCDDCQLACPWNKYAQRAELADFQPSAKGVQPGDPASLIEFFAWSAEEFATRTAGSAIRRIGHERWSRNLAVALGNAPTSPVILAALHSRVNDPSALVREHVDWAIAQHQGGRLGNPREPHRQAQN